MEEKVPVNTETFEQLKQKYGIAKILQIIIEQKGSSLSLVLCEQYISELQVSLERSLTYEDIELAADFFIKQEKS